MKYRFNKQQLKEKQAAQPELPVDLSARIYSCQLIGQDPGLVLHGGGSFSVKTTVQDLLGDKLEGLFVTSNGQDLASIGADGFSGLRLNSLKKLQALEALSDEIVSNQMLTNRLNAASMPISIEGLVHAFVPHKYIDHAHADAILVLTHQKQGEKLVQKVLGPQVAVIPYLKSGFALAKAAAKALEKNPRAEALVCMQHGIFTFGPDAQTAYHRMIHYVAKAEDHIAAKLKDLKAKKISADRTEIAPEIICILAQTIRGTCSFMDEGGKRQRFYLDIRDSAEMKSISLSLQAAEMCQTGALTPEHVQRTKNAYIYLDHLPKIDEFQEVITKVVERFRKNYDTYFEQQSKAKGVASGKLDNNPRVFLVAGIGLISLGLSRSGARIAGDIATHTLIAKQKAYALGDYQPIAKSHIIDLEYTDAAPEPEKSSAGDLAGQVAIVTGAAGAIGCGIANSLLQQGACVVVTDIDETRLKTAARILAKQHGEDKVERMTFDITDFSAVQKAMQEICLRFGGIDIVVPNAGIAHVATIESLDPTAFSKVTNVNLFGVFNIIKAAIPVFREQRTGGNIVLISSKNVFDPGAAFGAYSASKAAAHQICRIAALELAELGVRVNMINPDAVFGDQTVSSKLWDTIGPDRMKARGLDPEGLKEYYRKRNLLKSAVLPEHVGNAVVFFASEKTPTTGATLPVDGGVPAAFPR